MIKAGRPIVINSYPRSGSVFLSETLFRCLKKPQLPDSIHIPELIGTDQVISVVIARNPYECISSNLFRLSNETDLFKNTAGLNSMIGLASSVYCDYLDRAETTNAYIMDFIDLTTNTKEEVVKFLNSFDIEFYINKVINNYEDLPLSAGHLKNNDIFYGHFPRNAEKDAVYSKIKEYLLHNKDVKIAYEKYLEITKEK